MAKPITNFTWISSLLVSGALAATMAHADTRPLLDLSRGAIGAEGKVVFVNQDTSFAFVPGAWVSYSVTENLAAQASQGYNLDKKKWERGRVGLRMYVPNDPIRVALGVNYLYDWQDQDHSWNVGLYAGWHLMSRVAATASVEKDVPNDEISYRVGVKVLALGGK